MFRTLAISALFAAIGSAASAQDPAKGQCSAELDQRIEEDRIGIRSSSTWGPTDRVCIDIANFDLDEAVEHCLTRRDDFGKCARIDTFLALRDQGFYRAAFERNASLQRQETSEL
jgi:hypothetical protein